MTHAFSSDECDLLADALHLAWEICRQAGDPDDGKRERIKAALTHSILAGHESGERNARRLAILAVADLDRPLSQPPTLRRDRLRRRDASKRPEHLRRRKRHYLDPSP